MNERTCVTCNNYLGGGQYRINLEAECCESGGYEAWEPKAGDGND